MVIKPVWVAIVAAVVLLFLVFSKKISGFQNPTDQTDMKREICNILKNTYFTSKANYDSMSKSDLTKAAVIATQVEVMKQQMVVQGCEVP